MPWCGKEITYDLPGIPEYREVFEVGFVVAVDM